MAEAPTAAATGCGIRWSWDMYPMNRIDGSRMVVPLGALYGPLLNPCPKLRYSPLKCSVCGGILNPHNSVDFRSKTWGCAFCGTRNSFPQHYSTISEQHVPGELMRAFDTVEYVVPEQRQPPTFAFVIDTCFETPEEKIGLQEYLLLALSKLPEDANVAVITFGTTVNLHELAAPTDCSRCLVMRGVTDCKVETMKHLLKQPSKFVCPMRDVEFAVTSIFEDLPSDLWPVAKETRARRCTGAAIAAAASLLELVSPQVGCRIMAFLNGVCTEGPGQVVDCLRQHMIRTHADIRDKTANARHYDAAVSFYDGLMRRMVTNGFALDAFIASLDQVGFAEMKPCVQATGGMVIASDSWKKPQLKQSLNFFFERQQDDGNGLAQGLNATFDVLTSPLWKVMGVVGQCIGTGKRSSSVSDSELGMGGTCQWTTCAIDRTSTFAVYFETSSAPPQSTPAAAAPGQPKQGSSRYVQFITKYQSPDGTSRIRVSTVRHAVQETTNFSELANSFDQEASAVLMARLAIHKTESMHVFDVLRWLDRTLIRLVARFGDFIKDQPASLKLHPRFVFFPSFVYHLRRSAYLQVFNSSPDETALLRMLLLRVPCHDGIIMVHPTLFSYSMQEPPRPASLDTMSVQPDNVLVLDTFFEVVIHYGDTIAQWRKAGYEEKEEYAHFKAFVSLPRADVAKLVPNRYPAPRLIEVSQGEPNARILYNRINPSRTHNNADPNAQQNYGQNAGELVYTDDAPLQTFMEHLKKLAVQS